MTDHDEEIAKLERKNELMEKLAETLEQRIDLATKREKQLDDEMTKRDDKIQKLQEDLEREKKRPVQLSTPTLSELSDKDIKNISAVELLIYAEQNGIPWGR